MARRKPSHTGARCMKARRWMISIRHSSISLNSPNMRRRPPTDPITRGEPLIYSGRIRADDLMVARQGVLPAP